MRQSQYSTPIHTPQAEFATNEYRYEIQADASVQTAYPDARAISNDTQLDDASAAFLASKYLAEFKPLKRSFQIVFGGILSLDQLLTVLPSIQFNDPTYSVNGAGKPISVTVNHADQSTTVVVRI